MIHPISINMNFDYLFGPKYSSSSTSSSSSTLFGSIFPPSSSAGRSDSRTQDVGGKKFAAPGSFRNQKYPHIYNIDYFDLITRHACRGCSSCYIFDQFSASHINHLECLGSFGSGSVGFVPGTPSNKGESPSTRISNKNTRTNYQNETVEPSYYSSSIYYGGQENYSPRSRTTQPHHVFKKDKDDDGPNGNDSNSTSRGNWWEGSLYY